MSLSGQRCQLNVHGQPTGHGATYTGTKHDRDELLFSKIYEEREKESGTDLLCPSVLHPFNDQ